MIEVCYIGRLGNNLFQHFCAYLLSLKHNLKFKNPLESKLVPVVNDGNEYLEESSVQITAENFFDYYNLDDKHTFNFGVCGYFQSKDFVDLFWKNKNLTLQNTLCKAQQTGICSCNNNDVFIHVRLGDLLNTSKHQSYEYFENILKEISFENGYISSDSPDHEIVTKLINEYSLKLYSNEPEDTIIFASQQKYKILSLGTYSWWIGFLGKQENVYFPDPQKHEIWHGDIHTLPHWNLR